MLFLFKYIDDLIGKGFEWYVILELMWYASATNVAMALPLAVLLSSIMTFGSLGENYELVAIKSAGISLQKAMMPLLILIIGLSIGAFLFSDYMLPVANLKYGSLLYDVRNQKAAFLIEDGVFNSSIPGYSIRIEKKDPDGQTLYNVVIYEHGSNNGNTEVTMAKQGKMFRIDNDKTLVLKLKNGVRYSEQSDNKGSYDPREQFIRYRFKETEQKLDLSSFKMQRTDENLFKTSYGMLNLKQLQKNQDSTGRELNAAVKTTFTSIKNGIKFFDYHNYISKSEKSVLAKPYSSNILEHIPKPVRVTSTNSALMEVTNLSGSISNSGDVSDDLQSRIRRYIIEYHRKFTLSVSCLVLFSIGAPLGAIIRKGGLGLPVVMSIIFFLINHIISTIGEKFAREGDVSPIFGMWIAIIVLAPLGVFLTYKATVDSALFDVDYYKQAFLRLFKRKKAAA